MPANMMLDTLSVREKDRGTPLEPVYGLDLAMFGYSLDTSTSNIQDDTLGDPTMSNTMTEEENCLLNNEGDNVSVVSSSQGKRQLNNFTSPTYHQEELSNRGDIVDFLPMPSLISCMPGVTL